MMKFGKQQMHDLPINDIITQGAYAYELQRESRGEILLAAS